MKEYRDRTALVVKIQYEATSLFALRGFRWAFQLDQVRKIRARVAAGKNYPLQRARQIGVLC
jgi:hypothetical protein